MTDENYLSERGRQASVEMFGPGGDSFMERNNRRWAERVDADWARIMSEFIINGCYSRNILPTDVRELRAVQRSMEAYSGAGLAPQELLDIVRKRMSAVSEIYNRIIHHQQNRNLGHAEPFQLAIAHGPWE